MIRVLHVINSLGVGGAEMMLLKLIRSSDPRRVSHHVLSATGHGPLTQHFMGAGVRIDSLEMISGYPTLRGLLKGYAILDKVNPDLVQSWMVHSDVIGTLMTRFGTKYPLIWGIRNGVLKSGQATLIARMCVRACAFMSRAVPKRVVCNSRRSLEDVSKLGYSKRALTYIPNGFDTDQFQPDPAASEEIRKELNISPKEKIIGLIGRYHPVKGHAAFLRAMAGIHHLFPEWFIVMAGKDVDWENLQLSHLVDSLGLRGCTRLLGLRSDIHRVMAALNILVNSSESEGFPNVIGEAMSCEVPCVGTNVGESASVIDETGWICAPDSVPALEEALKNALGSSDAERLRRGRESRERIQLHFSLRSVVEKYCSLYAEVLASAKASALH